MVRAKKPESETQPVSIVKATTKSETKPVSNVKAAATKSTKSDTKKAPVAEQTSTKKASEPLVKAPKNDVTSEVLPEDLVTHDTPLSAEFVQVLSHAQALSQQLSVLRTSLRALEKKATRELKMANKAGKKHKRAKSNRQPSGFVKPTLISAELAKFLGKEKGVEMARTEVTKEINSYIRAHSLQDPKNGRRIIPDAKLVTLLSLKSDDELTYFNLQKFMSPHFAKSASAVAAAAAAAVATAAAPSATP
jgi:chromatin remodeling complex protein RSC6